MMAISQNDVGSGCHEILHVSWEYHFHHCTHVHLAEVTSSDAEGEFGG